MVVVGDQKVLVGNLMMEIVMRIMMHNLMDRVVRHQIMMGLMMDNLTRELYNGLSDFLYHNFIWIDIYLRA